MLGQGELGMGVNFLGSLGTLAGGLANGRNGLRFLELREQETGISNEEKLLKQKKNKRGFENKISKGNMEPDRET